MAQQPTYLLAPNFHFKPCTGPIGLGNIIADPLRPHRALTTVDANTLKAVYPRVETIVDHNRSITRGSSRTMSMAVWAQFVQTVLAKISGERGTSTTTNYNMDAVETAYFVTDPPLEEIESRLKAPRVQAVIKAGSIFAMRQPVYMVTGLIVAKGFTIFHESNLRSTGEVKVSGDAPMAVGDIGLGANFAKSTDMEESHKWKASEDIIFAYQLLKIEVKGWKGTKIEYDELRHKAAYLSNDDEDTEEEDDDEDENEIVGLVTTSVVGVDNIPISQTAGETTAVQLGEGESKITCISVVDTQLGKD